MSIKEWTDSHYEILKGAMQRITGNSPLTEELLHHTLLVFLEKPDVEGIINSGGGFFYCLRIATNNWKSVTSPFYTNYRNDKMVTLENADHFAEEPQPEELDIDGLAARIDKELESLSWYEKELVKAYAESGSNATALSKGTGIPRTSISLTIKRVRNYVKTKIRPEDHTLPI